jgi:hypothetical protein
MINALMAVEREKKIGKKKNDLKYSKTNKKME